MNGDNDIIQVEIYGISLSSSLTGGGYAIILKEVEGERRVPIIIGQFEAQAIALQLENITPPRPLTHDLLKNVIEAFGFSIEYIVINELKDSTFYARIKFDSETIEDIDARPSDAIALALKFNAPIYISASILDEIGFTPEQQGIADGNIDEEKKAKDTKADLKEQRQKKLEKLKKDLEDAVAKEEYEKAAALRDEIKKLENYNFN
ncbi:MAG: bifunctional nuclease family protein [Ignavibacteria bacterium]|nr:bifunctional nuclease family protein [Ignavibacteria bacterium]